MVDHLAISGGLSQAPLNPLKTDVSRGCQFFQVGEAPSDPTVIRPLLIGYRPVTCDLILAFPVTYLAKTRQNLLWSDAVAEDAIDWSTIVINFADVNWWRGCFSWSKTLRDCLEQRRWLSAVPVSRQGFENNVNTQNIIAAVYYSYAAVHKQKVPVIHNPITKSLMLYVGRSLYT